MPHKQQNLKRQLAHAKQDLDTRTDALDKEGVDTKQRRRDPAWREFKARCSQLQSRLRSATAVIALTEEVKKRKAEAPAKADKAKKADKAEAKKGSDGKKKQGEKGGKKKK